MSAKKTAIVNKIDGMVAKGMTVREALKRTKVNQSNYYAWKRKMKAKNAPASSAPITFHLPTQDNRVCVVIGPTELVQQILGRFT